MIKLIKYFFQSIFIYLFFILGRVFGINISRKIFSKLFSFLGPYFKSREVVEKNLNIFSKGISQSDKEKIVSKMWKNYGLTFIEYVFLDRLNKQSSHIKISGEENLIKAHNKPVIFISGHFANFELMSMEITKKNIKLATIYRPLNNFFLNPLMEILRRKFICKNQIKKGIKGVRDAIDFLKKNYSVALMIDQRVSEGEIVDFFGKPALTTSLPAQLAIKFNLEIIPVYIERKDNNSFEIEFQNAISPKHYNDKLLLTKKLNEILEKMIIKNPSQWIWTHNRWK